MNPRILNRDFQHPADGWYEVEHKGEHPNRRAGVVQVIDDAAVEAIVNRFNSDALAGRLSHGHEMLIDHEHFKHDSDKETRAYGWLQQLQIRADGYYGKIRWTGTGKPAVDDGSYRFFSTEYDPDDLEILNDGKPPKVRPLRLDGLTLTNEPNNKGGKPITNRELPADKILNAVTPGKKEADMIMNRAVELRKQTPHLSLATAVVLVQRGESGAIMNRADRLKRNCPGLSPATAAIMAQRERASVIFNRAFAMQKDAPHLSLAAATRMALRERPNGIMNRARDLRDSIPHLSLATAIGMAQREYVAAAGICNRAGDQPSDADWKAANAKADDVLTFLETTDEQSADIGHNPAFKELPSGHKFWTFIGKIKRLVTDEKLSISDAFQKIRETQPAFWTQSILDFNPKFHDS